MADPWWSGHSRWAALAESVKQPAGPFWHLSPTLFQPGDRLSSPAERQELPRFGYAAERLGSGLLPFSFDEHAVYVLATPRPREFAQAPLFGVYQVEPDGALWPDPEAPFGESWCCRCARVLSVLRPPGDTWAPYAGQPRAGPT